MMKKEKIGIIGLGYVGSAVRESYIKNPSIELVEIDLDQRKRFTGTYEDLHDATSVFICVPSPQNTDGSCDASELYSVMSKLKNFNKVVISKVTATPDVYQGLQSDYPNLVHVPEFLTAANAVEDYVRGQFTIIGGDAKPFKEEAERVIRIGQSNLKEVRFCSIAEASLAKYIVNSYLATKVVFMNEMSRLAEAGGQNWSVIRNLLLLDEKRMGVSHTQVPGPDGSLGFGGYCFPKDTRALLNYAKSLGQSLDVLGSAVTKNNIIRSPDDR